MDYDVVLTVDAEDDLTAYIDYLLFVKKNKQTAKNLLDDFESTKSSLQRVAGSLKLCDNTNLRDKGYHRMNFLAHRYFILYRIEDKTVFIDNIFHELQDYESKLY